MKRIWREKDKEGGFIEIQLLEGNIKESEDIIWLHCKRKGEKEVGITITPFEAELIIGGLFLVVNEVIRKYKLEKFKLD